MTTRQLFLSALLCSNLIHSGCVPVVVIGGAATAASVAHDRRTTGTIIEDEAIELRVGSALGKDTEINEQTHINVTSYAGAVLLTGEAPTEALRSRAGAIAREQKEVRRVNNEIAIAAPSSMMSRSSDSLLTTKVKTALLGTDIKGFDPSRIKVVTENGTVYLMGLVYHKEAAEVTERARQVGGVQRIVTLYQYLD